MKEPNIVVIPVEGQTRTEYVTRTVHEHRAPTDQSVALLREMESAAKQSVDQAIHIGDTSFECVVHVALDMLSDCTRMKAVFKLNGKTKTAEHSYRPRDSNDLDAKRNAAIALRDEVAKVIANEMVNDAFAMIYRR